MASILHFLIVFYSSGASTVPSGRVRSAAVGTDRSTVSAPMR